jgi:DNA modification methylase
LHLFSGKVDLDALPGDTVDINAELRPTYVDDAQTLERVPLTAYDLVLADPPYSVEDADRYQTTMVKRNTVLRALQGLAPGAHVVWLDQVLPMYRKDFFGVDAVIGMVKSTNHRFRVITVFRRLPEHVGATAWNRKQSVNRSDKGAMQASLEAAAAIGGHVAD